MRGGATYTDDVHIKSLFGAGTLLLPIGEMISIQPNTLRHSHSKRILHLRLAI